MYGRATPSLREAYDDVAVVQVLKPQELWTSRLPAEYHDQRLRVEQVDRVDYGRVRRRTAEHTAGPVGALQVFLIDPL